MVYDEFKRKDISASSDSVLEDLSKHDEEKSITQSSENLTNKTADCGIDSTEKDALQWAKDAYARLKKQQDLQSNNQSQRISNALKDPDASPTSVNSTLDAPS